MYVYAQATHTHTHSSTQPSARGLGAYISQLLFRLALPELVVLDPIALLKATTLGKTIHQSL